jgi:hypothetical protein
MTHNLNNLKTLLVTWKFNWLIDGLVNMFMPLYKSRQKMEMKKI